MKKQISIIIPIYNSENYIEKCLESVLEQTINNFEVILINDGSTDNSEKIIKKYTDNKIIKYYKKNNTGVSDTRNYGLKKANGDYILFVDSDDYLEPNMIEEFTKIIDKYSPDLISCGYFFETLKSKNQKKISYKEIYYKNQIQIKKNIMKLYESEILHNVWNKMFKKNIITKYKIVFPNINFGEEIDFMHKYLFNTNSFYNIDKCLYHYVRENKNSITTKYLPNLYNTRIDENEKYINFFKQYGLKENDYINFISKRFIERTIGCLENIHRKNNLSKKEKYKEVENIIHNDETKKYLKIYKTNNKKIKLILHTYKYKSPFIAYKIGYFIYCIKKYMPSIFNKIKVKR